MKELAIFGIIMLTVIGIALQHVAHYFCSLDIRAGRTDLVNTFWFAVTSIASLLLLYLAFYNAVKFL